jgi:excisionase family DNA binding protein
MKETRPSHLLPDDELLTVDELNAALKLPSKNWVYQRIHNGKLPFDYVKIGHYVRFPASSVRNYIKSQTKQSA